MTSYRTFVIIIIINERYNIGYVGKAVFVYAHFPESRSILNLSYGNFVKMCIHYLFMFSLK